MAPAKNDTASLFPELVEKLGKLHGDALENCPESTDELVWAILNDCGADDAGAWKIISCLKERFVDWNEARVARVCELARCMDGIEKAEEASRRIRECFNRLFDLQGNLSLSLLEEMKLGEARRIISDLESSAKTVSDRILMLENESSLLPFSQEAVDLAKSLKLIPKSGNRQHLNKALSGTVSREDSIAFYRLLEAHAASGCTKSKCPVCKK